MLLQVLRDEVSPNHKILLDQIAFHWHVTTIEVIGLLECQDTSALEKRTIFLVIDGLHSISDHFGQNVMRQILTQLGDLNQNCPGFIMLVVPPWLLD